MKTTMILGIALCGCIARGQTSLDQDPKERARAEALFSNPPTSSVGGTPAPSEGVPLPPPGSVPTSKPKPVFEPGEITLKTGAVIKGNVGKFTPETIQVLTGNGMIQLPVADLDPDFVLQFVPQSTAARRIRELDSVTAQLGTLGGDIQKQQQVADAVQKLMDIQKALSAASPTPDAQAAATAPAALSPGLNIVSFDAKEISREYGQSTIAWKVELLNNSDESVSDIYVHFSFRDKDGFELDDAIEDDVSLKPGEKKTVTSTTMMQSAIWDKVDSYHVKTD